MQPLDPTARRPFEIARFENDLQAALNYAHAIENHGEASQRPMRVAFVIDVLTRMLAASRAAT